MTSRQTCVPRTRGLAGGILLLLLTTSAAPAQTVPLPLTLTLGQATDSALKHNLQAVLSRERRIEARGQAGISLAELLPNLYASSSAADQTFNLAAMGFTSKVFPGIQPFLGPYTVFDARLRLTQTVFNLGAIWRYRAGRVGEALAADEERLAVQQVSTATALAYLRAAEAEQVVVSAKADVQLAERLLDLAKNQREAGLATGLDVTRAETRLAREQVRLAAAQTGQDTARLDLLRLIGAPLGSEITLSEPMRFEPPLKADTSAAVATALNERADLHAAGEQLRIARAQRKAALAGYAPTVTFSGDYGASGVKPNEIDLPTRSVAIGLSFPVFDGGRTRSEVQVASSRERQAEAQLKDLKAAIEKDVRQAIDELATRETQVRAAQKALALAERELDLAQDRFKNGVADNIEVVNAQTALESAREAATASLAQFNIARLNVAAAMGRAQDFRL